MNVPSTARAQPATCPPRTPQAQAPPPPRWRSLFRGLAIPAGLVCGSVAAQTTAAPAAAAAASAPAAAAQKIEITGRNSDTDQRRQSTAAKIVIGREEIEKFGDATVGEVLRRLPGVSAPGAPGRGGPPRLRGLGSGFTQLLLDGQRVPPGFSLESLTPEQIERIEILRAPTAETGARAIAGTINIITREGFRRRLNDLRIGMGVENGEISNGLFWTHNDSAGPLTYNLTTGVFRRHEHDERAGQTTETDLADRADRADRTLSRLENSSVSDSRRAGLNLGARLQWRLGEGGDFLVLNPTLLHSGNQSRGSDSLLQTATQPPAPAAAYAWRDNRSDSRFTNARLNLQWRQRLGESTRVELSAGGGQWRSNSVTLRDEYGGTDPAARPRHIDDRARTRERSANATLKLSRLLGGDPDAPGSEHSLVSGLEIEGVRRSETRTNLLDGESQLPGFDDHLEARTQRLAAYAQDEWNLNPSWAVNVGLRWEGIGTRGDNADGSRPVNRSSVWTPLAHLLWKPDPARRDQVRLSLTRSYRSPGTGALIGRPTINSRAPVTEANTPTTADSAGNPGLKPELATGLDLAFERYLEGGGVLSANVFARRISGLMRSVVDGQPEVVRYSDFPRFVSRQQNIGRADVQGIELEAKYRLDQWLPGAPGVELRHNLSLYRSRVGGIPGPDNRLDEQAGYSANIGADYRLRGTPLTLGGNLNLVPEVRTQLAADRLSVTTRKQVFDVFALWAFNPQVGLRLSASNLAPQDYGTLSQFDYERDGRRVREEAQSAGPSFTNWQLRLELRL